MSTVWKVGAATAVVGWLVSPIISLLLPKIISYLGFDASEKLEQLEIHILPELENTLGAVDRERMTLRGKKKKSDVAVLDKMAAMLRHAREDAEDIFDDAQEIELYRNMWPQRLYGAVNPYISVCYGGAAAKAWVYIVVRYGTVKACIARCVSRDPILDRLVDMQKKLQTLSGEKATEMREKVDMLIRMRKKTHMGRRDKLMHRLYGAVATCKTSCVWLLRWAVMVSYCSRLYGAVESGMWIALEWPAKMLSGAVERIFTMWIASITRCGPAWLLHWAKNRFQEYVHSVTASHVHVVDIGDSDDESIPEAVFSNSAPPHNKIVSKSAVLEATPSESASNETVSEPTTSELASDEKAVSDSASVLEEAPEGTTPKSASNEIDTEATLSDSTILDEEVVLESSSVPEEVSEATLSDEEAVSESASVLEDVPHSTPSELASKAIDSETTLSYSAILDEEAVSESAFVPEEVSGSTPSESASNKIVSEPPLPDSASSDEEAVSESASVPEEVQEATLLESSSNEIVSDGTFRDSASSDEETVSGAMPPDSASVPAGAVLPTCGSLDGFKNHCRSFCYWLVHVFEVFCFYRNWSYEGVGITSNQDNNPVLDSVLTAITRWNLKKRIEKVESIAGEMNKSPLLGVTSKSAPDDIANKNRSTIRFASSRKVFGREALRDTIMEKLQKAPNGDIATSSTSPCYSGIGIYGVAGSGKTTFARYIRDYIKEEYKEELFDVIMCIHVSETFRVDDIFLEMPRDIMNNPRFNISDGEEVKEKLMEKLGGKRFFLILDDLWVDTKSDPQLEELISPLITGLKGSKILVTARTRVVAGILCADDEPMEMPALDEDQYLSMFMHYARGGTSVVDQEFKRVGRVIVEKLRGSLIAAVIVAGRLGANQDIGFWRNTAELDIFNDTMDTLWWSYQQLSLDIRRCFEYCNIFPRRF